MITKETIRRALRTFLQAFIPCLTAGIVEVLQDNGSFTKGAIIAFILPAISAGIAAVMNIEKIEESEEEEDG